jgi:hypothetical protein
MAGVSVAEDGVQAVCGPYKTQCLTLERPHITRSLGSASRIMYKVTRVERYLCSYKQGYELAAAAVTCRL